MQYGMNEIIETFELTTGIDCELILGSSGKLSAQITNGAPYDIFVSADTDYPQALYENGMCEDPPRVYAEGNLVLWTVKENWEANMELLASDSVIKIAIANPTLAPYGVAALEVFENLGVYSDIEGEIGIWS